MKSTNAKWGHMAVPIIVTMLPAPINALVRQAYKYPKRMVKHVRTSMNARVTM